MKQDHSSVSVATLKAVLDAFNAHDLDLNHDLLLAMTRVLEMPQGPDPWDREISWIKGRYGRSCVLDF